MKKAFLTIFGALLFLSGILLATAQSLSADEILREAAQIGPFSQDGGRLNVLTFTITDDDGTTVERSFAAISKQEAAQPDKLLIYFLEPELDRGTMFLAIDPEDPTEKSKLWLYLSAFGQVKELVSDQDRNAGFGGSDLQNDQMSGGFDLSKDYSGQLVAEEQLSLRWLGQEGARTVLKIALTQRPGTDVDFPTASVWIDEETFLIVKIAYNNTLDQVEQIIDMDDVIAFEGEVEPNVVTVRSVLKGGQTVITLGERSKLDLADDVFSPENLSGFEPEQYGLGI